MDNTTAAVSISSRNAENNLQEIKSRIETAGPHRESEVSTLGLTQERGFAD